MNLRYVLAPNGTVEVFYDGGAGNRSNARYARDVDNVDDVDDVRDWDDEDDLYGTGAAEDVRDMDDVIGVILGIVRDATDLA